MPTSDQKLLQLSLDRFATRGREKFEAGIEEHGHAGTLVDNVTPAHMEEEVIDLFHYLRADRVKRQELAQKVQKRLAVFETFYLGREPTSEDAWSWKLLKEIQKYLTRGEE